jgi:biopolymer transport protein ExbB
MEFLKTYLDVTLYALLGGMSFLAVAFTLERYIYFARVDLKAFKRQEELDIALTRHLTIIATVGTNAPYVGLLGTVLGILISFYDMGQEGTIDTATIMLGLALALQATALGLIVAMPSIVFYNALVRRVDVLKARWGGLVSDQG